MECLILKNKEVLFHKNSKPRNRLQQKKEVPRKKRSIPNKSSKIQNIKVSKLRCWTCGLYKGDAELCSKCKNRTSLGGWINS